MKAQSSGRDTVLLFMHEQKVNMFVFSLPSSEQNTGLSERTKKYTQKAMKMVKILF